MREAITAQYPVDSKTVSCPTKPLCGPSRGCYRPRSPACP